MPSVRLDCHFYNCLRILSPLFITFDIQNEPHAFIVKKWLGRNKLFKQY